jgi:hypothetical protein
MDELDVYFTPYLLSLNSPAGMCDFTGFMPYWYYSQLPGVANDTFKTTTNPSGTTLNFDKDTTSGNPSTLVQVNTSGQPQCAYDYSPNGPNCCMGNYTWTKVNIDSTGNTTTNVINDKWPGKWGNCGAGAGYNVSPSGFSSALATPAEIIDNSTGGKLITYNFKSGIQIKAASNVHMANYIKPTTIKPGGLVGPGGVIKAPSQYYFIKCYDHAMEENAWIRLQIQEWNVGGEILKKALGNPDISGADPIPPVYPADNPPTYNDFADWDDYVTGGVQYPGN